MSSPVHIPSSMLFNGDPRTTWYLFETVDPAQVRGWHVGHFLLDPAMRHLYMVRARIIGPGTFSQIVEGVKNERRFFGRDPDVAIIDSRGAEFVVDRDTDERYIARLQNYGLRYEKSIETDLETLHDWLKPQFDPTTGLTIPRLRFTVTVANMEKGPFWSMERFKWGPDISRTERYRQEAKDWIDVMRYTVGWISLQSEQAVRARLESRRGPRRQQGSRLAESYPRPRGGVVGPASPRHLEPWERIPSRYAQ